MSVNNNPFRGSPSANPSLWNHLDGRRDRRLDASDRHVGSNIDESVQFIIDQCTNPIVESTL